jgi:hypothetical protein
MVSGLKSSQPTVTKDLQGPVIRQLSANINRLNALDFDSGYAAGYEAGVKYTRMQLLSESTTKESSD